MKKMLVRKIIQNAIATPDGTMLNSLHGLVSHNDNVNGLFYFVDGGLSYIRRSMNESQSLVLYSDDKFSDIREKLLTYGGINGDDPNNCTILKEMNSEQILNLIKYEVDHRHLKYYKSELRIRNLRKLI